MTHLAAIVRLVAIEERRDGDLLLAFLHRRDEAAFAELIRRHGPMVWGVCRRSLPDAADAEDAFQAAFLVLVRKAHQLTRQATVGPWLYRVAAWTSRNLRRKNARRMSRTVPLSDVPNVVPREPGFDLDAALLALPEKYRTPLVLCHLIGLSRREAALHLGCPEGTLSARLSRALAKLRIKLLGQDPQPMLAAAAGGIVPTTLATATERTAIAFALASLIPTTAGPAAMLAEGVLRMFWIKKAATTAVAAMVMIASAGMMVGVVMNGNGKLIAQEQKSKVNEWHRTISESQDLLKRMAQPNLNRSDMLEYINTAIQYREIIVQQHQDLMQQFDAKNGTEKDKTEKQRIGTSQADLIDRLTSEVFKQEAKLFYYVQLTNKKPASEHIKLQLMEKRAVDFEKQFGADDPRSRQAHAQTEAMRNTVNSLKKGCLPREIAELDPSLAADISSIAWTESGLRKILKRIKSEQPEREPLIYIADDGNVMMVDMILKAVCDCEIKSGQIRVHAKAEVAFPIATALQKDLSMLRYKVEDFSKLQLNFKD